jgi:hypothetical protein
VFAVLFVGVIIGAVLVRFFPANAGDLDPSAPPGPTMKTLDEVEARIPIPGSSSPTGTFVITSPGSYYLTGDRHADGTGIVVTVDNVTIDLNGYSLIGGGYDVYAGIGMNSEENVEIRNGTIRNFQTAIYESNTDARSHRVINVRAVSNSLSGIHLRGRNHLVKDCIANDNGALAESDVYGIYVGKSSAVTGCTANDNGEWVPSGGVIVAGIFAEEGGTVTGNTANRNGDYSLNASVAGIFAMEGSRVTGNTASYNGGADGSSAVTSIHVSGDKATRVTADTVNEDRPTGIPSYFRAGIYVMDGSTVTGNTAYRNGYLGTTSVYGIYLVSDSLVDQNTAKFNSGADMTTPATCTYGVNEY